MALHSPMALSHLKIRHLMLVDFLVKHGTLHKAAKLLNISQPAATGMLNDLEQLLGIGLFTRSRQGVAPTPAAQSLLDKARTLLNEFNDFTTAVARAAEGRDMVLRVGVVPQAFVAYMPQTIDLFRSRGGGALRAQEGTARQLLDLLFGGQLDCVIGRLPSDGLPEGRLAADLSMVPIYRDEVCLVVRPDHPLLTARRIGFERLAQEQWVLQRRDSSVRRALAEAFLREGFLPPDPAVETTTYIQNIAVVAQSNLLSIAPRRAAEQQARLGQIAILDFKLNVEPMQVNMLVRAGSGQHAMLNLFRTALQESVAAEVERERVTLQRKRSTGAAPRSLAVKAKSPKKRQG